MCVYIYIYITTAPKDIATTLSYNEVPVSPPEEDLVIGVVWLQLKARFRYARAILLCIAKSVMKHCSWIVFTHRWFTAIQTFRDMGFQMALRSRTRHQKFNVN
jgi:hypothetical protein